MTIIESIRTYLMGYSALKVGAPLWVDFLGPKPTQYAILPSPGTKLIEECIDGSSSRAYPFVFQSVESTADDIARMATNGFYEALGEWFETQTEAGILPTMSVGKTPTAIETNNWATLFEQGQSDTGIYQVQCRLLYNQLPH